MARLVWRSTHHNASQKYVSGLDADDNCPRSLRRLDFAGALVGADELVCAACGCSRTSALGRHAAQEHSQTFADLPKTPR
jgi:hypothetical protein